MPHHAAIVGVGTVLILVTDLTWLILLNFIHQATQAGPTVRLQDLHAEDLRDLAISCEYVLIKHTLPALVDDIAHLVNQVATWINQTALSVNEVAIVVLVKNGF